MKKILTGCLVVFVLMEVLDFVIHGVILADAYRATQGVWRPDMMEKMWIFYIVNLVVAFFVSFIFSKGYEGKGIMEGVRYGFYIGVMLSMGMAWGTYAMISIPWQLSIHWFMYGVIEYILIGIALALIFGKKSVQSPM
jgi:hypothetical protein